MDAHKPLCGFSGLLPDSPAVFFCKVEANDRAKPVPEVRHVRVRNRAPDPAFRAGTSAQMTL
jgi:hypothetical protein